MSSSSQSTSAQAAPTIRVDSPQLDPIVTDLFELAFGPGRLARTAERLREGNECLYDLSRVALIGDKAVAAVRLWPLDVGGTSGVVFVGPVAVDKSFRGGSMGLALTELCLQATRQAGWRAAILVGDAGYFGRIGFTRIDETKITLPGHVVPGRLLGVSLQPGALEALAGPVTVPHDARPASSAE